MFRLRHCLSPQVAETAAEMLLDLGQMHHLQDPSVTAAPGQLQSADDFFQLAAAFSKAEARIKFRAIAENWSWKRVAWELSKKRFEARVPRSIRQTAPN